MGVCAKCGNDYDKTFDIIIGAKQMTFDSFECAIAAVAPQCAHCGCRIIGHGVEGAGQVFCCAHCARHGGAEGLRDRV